MRKTKDPLFNFRCRICNVVSHSEIASDYGDHSESAFYEEDDRLGHLCHSCYVSVTSAVDDFSVDEDYDLTEDDFLEYEEPEDG